MARRVVKHTMGIQDNGQNTNRRDVISTSIQKRGSYPSWSQTHKLQGGQLWWKKERRGHVSTAWSSGRS